MTDFQNLANYLRVYLPRAIEDKDSLGAVEQKKHIPSISICVLEILSPTPTQIDFTEEQNSELWSISKESLLKTLERLSSIVNKKFQRTILIIEKEFEQQEFPNINNLRKLFTNLEVFVANPDRATENLVQQEAINGNLIIWIKSDDFIHLDQVDIVANYFQIFLSQPTKKKDCLKLQNLKPPMQSELTERLLDDIVGKQISDNHRIILESMLESITKRFNFVLKKGPEQTNTTFSFKHKNFDGLEFKLYYLVNEGRSLVSFEISGNDLTENDRVYLNQILEQLKNSPQILKSKIDLKNVSIVQWSDSDKPEEITISILLDQDGSPSFLTEEVKEKLAMILDVINSTKIKEP